MVSVALGDVAKRIALGRPLRSDRLDDQELPKKLALPVFASDALSSVAYATQEILLVLSLAGTAVYHDAIWIGLAVGAADGRRRRVLPAERARLPQRRRRLRGRDDQPRPVRRGGRGGRADDRLRPHRGRVRQRGRRQPDLRRDQARPATTSPSRRHRARDHDAQPARPARGRHGVRDPDLCLRGRRRADARRGACAPGHRRPHHRRERALPGRPRQELHRVRARLPPAAVLRLRLHGADRRRGDQQRRAVVQEAQVEERRHHARPARHHLDPRCSPA